MYGDASDRSAAGIQVYAYVEQYLRNCRDNSLFSPSLYGSFRFFMSSTEYGGAKQAVYGAPLIANRHIHPTV